MNISTAHKHKYKHMQRFFYLLFIVLTAVSCNTASRSTDSAETYLAGNIWYLEKIHTTTGTTTVPPNIASLKFDAEKKSAGGKGGCNSFGTRYSLQDNSIHFKDLFSTRMYCEAYADIEKNYFSQLEKANRFEASESRLALFKDKELLLEFGK